MKTNTTTAALLACLVALGCEESKTDKPSPAAAATTSASPSLPPMPSSLPTPAPSASVTWVKKAAADCKPHPTTIDFGDDSALEKEVRKKTGKDTAAITASDLAQIKSINLATARVHQVDPCIFPMFTSLKDLFLGPGEYDDLTPIQKLATLEALVVSTSQVKDLRPIEGLKRLDRLDISHTLVGDEQFKSVGSLVNVTELMLDEDAVSDLTPVSNLKKLMRLSLKKTQVKSLAPLAQLKGLKFVYIAETGVSDITPVQPLISGGMKLVQN